MQKLEPSLYEECGLEMMAMIYYEACYELRITITIKTIIYNNLRSIT